MLNRILVVTCSFTLLATSYLSLSALALRPPRLNYQAWFLMAGLFIVQSVLTLAAVVGTALKRRLRRRRWLRPSLLTGGVAIVSVGVWWVRETLSGSHFEGYALVLGSCVVVQGALTLLRLVQFDDFSIAARPN